MTSDDDGGVNKGSRVSRNILGRHFVKVLNKLTVNDTRNSNYTIGT